MLAGLTPHGLLSNRRVLVALACLFSTTVLFFAFSSNSPSTYEWLPSASSSRPFSGFAIPPKNPSDPDVVELDYLSFRPIKSDEVKTYWNIPYAASAGGQNRFRGPQPITWPKWKGVMEWSGKLGMCPSIQKIDPNLRNREDLAGEGVPGWETEHSEDCLSLNVFTPVDAEPGDELPVLVNIPGGGFHYPGRSNGGDMVAKSRKVKNGKVVDKGIILVTMYYRNGIYGFLSGDEIEKDGDFNGGLRDQRAALEWVQKYIRYFGGNPDHVVLMGTSAGGASVLLQLTGNGGDHKFSVPGTGRKPLFHGAIAQSAASPTFYTKDQAYHFWRNVALGVNCPNMSVGCVRNASIGDLYYQNYPMHFPERKTPPRWMWAPTAEPEGGIWTEPATQAILEGRYAKVPTLVGFTTNEGSDQVFKTTDNEGEFKSYLKDHYPLLTDEDLDGLVQRYPNDVEWPDSGKWWDAVTKAQGDMRYICPQYLTSNAMAKHNPSDVKTWQYQWDVVWGVDIENGYGTKHAGTVGQVMARPDNEISDYFLSFIKHLDPNVERRKGTANWGHLDMENPKRLFFTNRKNQNDVMKIMMKSPDPDREKRCQYIRSIMPRLQQEILKS
ncbi:Alpha/Beta hydrolase protein [Lophiotrema nucula]|uniref:Carboxylic ester hydrolase n=1 Tax=Lophiotrema nucula TaxID=690887 RepID=A0A6A5YVA7_9PLEO|nr:Alpha/Beta hydrolase protein [Lophiotrema nucula]